PNSASCSCRPPAMAKSYICPITFVSNSRTVSRPARALSWSRGPSRLGIFPVWIGLRTYREGGLAFGTQRIMTTYNSLRLKGYTVERFDEEMVDAWREKRPATMINSPADRLPTSWRRSRIVTAASLHYGSRAGLRHWRPAYAPMPPWLPSAATDTAGFDPGG